jgi:hypothetical protein
VFSKLKISLKWSTFESLGDFQNSVIRVLERLLENNIADMAENFGIK